MDSLLRPEITRESIRVCIDKLIRKYHDLPEGHRTRMSEQDVRDYFVTPLLESLGWGIIDPRERAAERYLPRHGFSDYELCLPIGPDSKDAYTPVIYVEAKKFDALSALQTDLFGYPRRSDADKQACEYADRYNPKRGEKIGWAILTNFEFLRVWDTRRNVLVESVDWFSELKRERSLEVLYLLSRDEVARDPRLTGLSGYRKLPEIDEKFLAKLNQWRSALAQWVWGQDTNRAKLGGSTSERQSNLRTVVQRTLDRLIVIRTAEDRGLLPTQYRLSEMVRNFGGNDAIPLKLLENIQRNTFSWFDHRYNSKLFGPHLADSMEVPNVPLTMIINEMSQADFAAMNADILGATYEQYLGQTIVISSENGKPELVPNLETRHEQGSYYTPRPVVQAIVDQTLRKYIDGEVSDSGVRRRKRISEIDRLTVLDPACGSGSFLIYAYDVLHEFYDAERARIEKEIEERIAEIVGGGIPRLAAESQHDPELLRLRAELELTRFAPAKIIERHLFGVDLDPQAAEVASMNLLLKALTRDQRLPRILGDNIKVGNSLVSGAQLMDSLSPHRADLESLIILREQIHSQTLLANENSSERPKHEQSIERLDREFREIAERVSAVLNKGLMKVGESGWFDDLRSIRPFNWQVEFPEQFSGAPSERGFTFVLGNPPYVGFHGFKEQKPFLRDTYEATLGKFDLYVPFLERGLGLTRSGGSLSFICPSTFMKRGFGSKLRRLLLEQSTITSLHDFQHMQVFRNVLNYTCIPVFTRTVAPAHHLIEYSEGVMHSGLRMFAQEKLSEEPWIFRFGSDEILIERLRSNSNLARLDEPTLSSGVAEGIVTGKNSVLLISEAEVQSEHYELDFLRPAVRGEDVKRYSVKWGGYYVFYPYELRDGQSTVIDERTLSSRCPILYRYLLGKRAELAKRTYMLGTKKQWYEIWCQRELSDHAAFKILTPELADRSQFCCVGPDYFYVDTICGLRPSEGIDPWYVLGIMNSKPAEYLYRKTTVPKANGFLIYKTMFLNPFRIPHPTRVSTTDVLRIADLAKAIQLRNSGAVAIESRFASLLDASLPIVDSKRHNFYSEYYSVPAFWRSRQIEPDVLHLRDTVLGIRVETDKKDDRTADSLVLSFLSAKDAEWRPIVELQGAEDDLTLFFLLSIRRFLRENARKKSWTIKRGAERTVDVILQNLALPVWNLFSLGSAASKSDSVISKIRELIHQLRRDFPGQELDPCILERNSQKEDAEIDEIAYRLYGFEDSDKALHGSQDS